MNTSSRPISNTGATVPYDTSKFSSVGFLSSQEDTVNGTGAIFSLEGQFKRHLGFNHALAVCNATLGLMAALDVCGVRNAEVIVPPYTWGGSLSGLLYLGNRPVFADIDKETLTLDPKSVRERVTSRTKAILAVDIYGNPCHAQELRQIADEFGLVLTQDCAQSFGAFYEGFQSGNLADLAIYSFSPGKTLSSASGGMICCRDSSLYEQLVWNTQHPARQKRDLPGTTPNQFALNLRIDTYAAVFVSDRFEDELKSIQVNQLGWEKVDQHLAKKIGTKTIFGNDYRPSGYRYTVDTGSLSSDQQIVEALAELGVGGGLNLRR